MIKLLPREDLPLPENIHVPIFAWTQKILLCEHPSLTYLGQTFARLGTNGILVGEQTGAGGLETSGDAVQADPTVRIDSFGQVEVDDGVQQGSQHLAGGGGGRLSDWWGRGGVVGWAGVQQRHRGRMAAHRSGWVRGRNTSRAK